MTRGGMMAKTALRCECGNYLSDPDDTLCEHCDWVKDEPPHKGHWSRFGAWWCDTCDSPYCELA